MKYRIDAILKTLTPLHIAAPGAFRLNPETGYVEYASSSNERMAPCTGIQKIKVNTGTGIISLPVIAANNINGALRRHVASIVLKSIRAHGRKVSLQAFSSLVCGAATSAPDKRDLSITEYRKSSSEPYMGLMGGGPRMLARRAWLHNAEPLCQESINHLERFAHPRASAHLQDTNKLTMAWHFRHNDDLMDLANVELQEECIENYESAIQERQAAIMEEKAKGDRSKISTFAFSSFEFVIPGTLFGLLFEPEVNEAQLGLYLLALDSFAANERLGGHARNGFGAFSLKDVVMTDESGKEVKIFENGRLDKTNKDVAPFLSAWANAAATVDVDLIEEMLTMQPVKEKKGKKVAQAEV